MAQSNLISWILDAAPLAAPPVAAVKAAAPVPVAAVAAPSLLDAILADVAPVNGTDGGAVIAQRAMQEEREAAFRAEDEAREREAIQAAARPGGRKWTTNTAVAARPRMVAVEGDTYPVREELKRLGARWNAGAKQWMVPADRSDEAQGIVATVRRAPRAAARPAEPMVPVYGQTYMVRGDLKAMGGRWNGADKVWMVPASRAAEVADLPGVYTRPEAAPKGRERHCVSCGAPESRPSRKCRMFR